MRVKVVVVVGIEGRGTEERVGGVSVRATRNETDETIRNTGVRKENIP